MIQQKDVDSGKRTGLFQASYRLQNSGLLDGYEEEQLTTIRDWFNDNLKKPTSVSKSGKPHARDVAISWFKDSAKEHIKRMYALKPILEVQSVSVDLIWTPRPRYVVYENESQLTAQPYAETAT
ncbi:MAG: hypothetical protein AAF385_11260 [Pseudomonadota bacterium]